MYQDSFGINHPLFYPDRVELYHIKIPVKLTEAMDIIQPVSIYIHIPFCQQRCNYCDFNTYAGQQNRIPDYVTALCREIQHFHQNLPTTLSIHTVYFGGGTPSLIPPLYLNKILNKIRENFIVSPDAEISIEANPGTIDYQYLHQLTTIGFNRISFGVQSIHPAELKILNRIHDTFDSIKAFYWAKKAGFTNINIDLIYGQPEQTLESWINSIKLAVQLLPQHMSLYGLTIEKGTRLHQWITKGILSYPDEDLAADMYLSASEILSCVGYNQYEISNWALSKKTNGAEDNLKGGIYSCRHNLQYWHNDHYIGFGAGAHGFISNFRLANFRDINHYIKHINTAQLTYSFPQSPATEIITPVSTKDEISETLMVGLRLTVEGVSEKRFYKRFNEDLYSIYQNQINRFISIGLLEWLSDENDRCLRLTPKGRLLGNQVFMEFITPG